MNAPGAMVLINGQAAGVFTVSASPQHWVEASLWLPSEFLQAGENVIEVVGTYVSAHYWLYQ
jgi:hypothetical protein